MLCSACSLPFSSFSSFISSYFSHLLCYSHSRHPAVPWVPQACCSPRTWNSLSFLPRTLYPKHSHFWKLTSSRCQLGYCLVAGVFSTLLHKIAAHPTSPIPFLPHSAFLFFIVPECVLSHFTHVWLCATLWTIACQAPLSMRFSRQEYWSGLPFPPPRDLPNPGIKPASFMSNLQWQGGPLPLVPPGKPPWYLPPDIMYSYLLIILHKNTNSMRAETLFCFLLHPLY